MKTLAPTPSECSLIGGLFNAGRYAELEFQARALSKQYPQSGFVWQALASSLQLQGKDGLPAFEKVVELLPGDAQAHSNLGNALNEAGRPDDAVASYSLALDIDPQLVEAHYNLGTTLKDLGRPDEAVASFRRVLEINPNLAEAHSNLGNTLKDLGQLDEAVASLRRALAIKPDSDEVHNNLGNALNDLGQLDEAVASYRRALEIDPQFAGTHFNLGNTLKDLGYLDDSVAEYRLALALDPDYAEAHSNLGNALKDLGYTDDAMESYRRALSINADLAEAHCNLGSVLNDLGQLDEALECYRRALAIKPDMAAVHSNLGAVLNDLGQLDEAAASARRALQIDADCADAHNNLGNTLKVLGEIKEAVTSLRRALVIKPGYADAHSSLLLTMQYVDEYSPAEIFAEHLAFAQQFEQPLKASWLRHGNSVEHRKRLKVGYVSPDFRQHSVAYFIEPVLANHDKNEVEVWCYYNLRWQDAVTERIKGTADHWLDCSRLSDDDLAQRIREDGIDILVDLAGHTVHNRLLTFARRPAPIQLTWLGFSMTTGLAAMDYRLTDHHADPVGMTEHFNTETLWRLPGMLSCYRAPGNSPPVIDHPPSEDKGYITFGSFNNYSKISDAVLKLWAQLLSRVPTARLLLKVKGIDRPAFRSKTEERLQRLGLPLQRVILEAWSEHPLSLYNSVDIALDPFPYNGTTTSMDTLWMGVPFIALAGNACISRMGVTILTNAGLPELIAQTPDAYVELATQLALNPGRLHELRDQLRQKIQQSPLMDETTFTRQLEAAYREMWLAYCTEAEASAGQ